MKKTIFFCLVCMIGIMVNNADAAIGNTSVAKWKDNKSGAFSLELDDSMLSHADYAIPNFIKRGLVGTFWVNPALSRYGYGIETWESLVSRTGMELCAHSMNHIGASDFEEADYEVGESCRTIWSLNPPGKSKLLLFLSGGGTTWPSGYREKIAGKYPLIGSRGGGKRYGGPDNAEAMTAYAQKAIDDGIWHSAVTHGAGPHAEYLAYETSSYEGLLDYLASVKDQLWIGTSGDIHKYVQERESANVSVLESTNSVIRLDLTSDKDPGLYDYPLTLITEVPANWSYCHVSQGNLQSIHPVKSGVVQYEAIPGRGVITLKSSQMDLTPPSIPVVRDGTGTDIGYTLYTTQISANWDAASDAESGISRYWYRIGTTPGGAEVLDWIDNGLERSVTATRTNLSLIRGEKYYVTVKVVNGVGLSSEGISDGQTVNVTPNYIVFSEDFDTGYFSQWDELNTKGGYSTNEITVSDGAAHAGSYGIECHIRPERTNNIFLAKNNVTEFNDVFTRFYFKLSSDFTIPAENGNIQLMRLTDSDGDFVAGVYISSTNTAPYIYVLCSDNTGQRVMLPCSISYTPGIISISLDTWHCVDVRTRANAGKGGTELWVDGVRKGCISNRFTDGKGVRNLYIGVPDISSRGISGYVYIDDITVSDSYLRPPYPSVTK